MDFSRLGENSLDYFLKIYDNNIYGIDLDEKISNTKILFDELAKNSKSLYPYDVIDLFISSKINVTENTKIYSLTDLNTMEEKDKKNLAKILFLDISHENFHERLTRILSFVGLIDYSDILSTVLVHSDYGTIKNICETSKYYKNICNDKNFWKRIYLNKYEDVSIKKGYEIYYALQSVAEDFNSNSHLKYINGVIRLKASDHNGIDILIRGLEKSTSYTKLSMYGNNTSMRYKVLQTALSNNNRLKILKLEYVVIIIEDNLDDLAIKINKLKTFEYRFKEGDMLIKNIINNLNNGNLKELIVPDLPDSLVIDLGNILKNNKSLKYLHCKINDSVIDGLNSNTTLTNLKTVGLHSRFDKLIINFSNYLRRTTTLKVLNVSNNQLWYNGASQIFGALLENKSITELDISTNNIMKNKVVKINAGWVRHRRDRGAGIEFIVEFLENNKTLKILNLADNSLKLDHSWLISGALTKNTTLRKVFFGMGPNFYKQLFMYMTKSKMLPKNTIKKENGLCEVSLPHWISNCSTSHIELDRGDYILILN